MAWSNIILVNLKMAKNQYLTGPLKICPSGFSRGSLGRMGVLALVLHPSELAALFRLKKKVSEWKKRSASQEREDLI